MVARYAGASLGLLAFTIAVSAGLLAQNPVSVTLSRAIFALFAFCLLGLALGTAAQLVVAEYQQQRETEIRDRFKDEIDDASSDEPSDPKSTEDVAAPVRT